MNGQAQRAQAKAQSIIRAVAAASASASSPESVKRQPPAAAFASTGGRGASQPAGSNAKEGGKGVRKLAGLGPGPGTQMGPQAPGSGSGTSGAVVSWLKNMDSVVGKASEREAGPTDDPIPIANARVVDRNLNRIEPQIIRKGNKIVLVGSELVCQLVLPPAIGGVTSVVPQGGLFTVVPLNPMFCDGMRVAKMMSAFDQFALKRVALEYVPMNNAIGAAGGITMVISNDSSDLITVEGGFSALRDAMSRPGSVTFNVYAKAVASENQPLLKWYYTARADDADFMIPGQAVFMSATDQSNATANPVPLGLVWMHYEIALRSAENQQLAPQSYAQATASLSFTACATGANLAIGLPAAGAGLPASHSDFAVLGWGTVVAADDAAWGSSTWRQWRHPVTGRTITISPGCVIYWRYFVSAAAGALFCFFATFKEALEFEAVSLEGAMLTTVLQVAATVRGFKICAIQGAQLPGF